MAAGTAVAAAGYATYAAVTWSRYGHPAPPRTPDRDPLLDRFMPTYEIVDRHHISVRAPADVTLAAAKQLDLSSSRVIRGIFTARELLLGASPDRHEQPRGLLAHMLSLGWGVLAEIPDREIVVGAVTRPWEANVTFNAVSPQSFAAFAEPGFVKIVWTLRADPVDDNASIFRTETRAVATDDYARDRFRIYWSFLSPGIVLIRKMMLRQMHGLTGARADRRAFTLSTRQTADRDGNTASALQVRPRQ
jgi:hypothetical protein